METSTLQLYLAKGQQPDASEKRLYVQDEVRFINKLFEVFAVAA
jgi:hypothetical protein